MCRASVTYSGPATLLGVNIISGWDGWAGHATLHDTDATRTHSGVYESHARAAHVPTVGKTKTHANNVAAEARSLSTQGVAAREAPARAAIGGQPPEA